MRTEIQRNRMRPERDTPWNNLAISPSPWPNDPLPRLSLSLSLSALPDKIREERRVDFIAINLQYDHIALYDLAFPRAAPNKDFIRFPIIPSRLEMLFTNSHDLTKPIVRSDDGEVYRQWMLHRRYPLLAYQSLHFPLPCSESLWTTMIDFESRSNQI